MQSAGGGNYDAEKTHTAPEAPDDISHITQAGAGDLAVGSRVALCRVALCINVATEVGIYRGALHTVVDFGINQPCVHAGVLPAVTQVRLNNRTKVCRGS